MSCTFHLLTKHLLINPFVVLMQKILKGAGGGRKKHFYEFADIVDSTDS